MYQFNVFCTSSEKIVLNVKIVLQQIPPCLNLKCLGSPPTFKAPEFPSSHIGNEFNYYYCNSYFHSCNVVKCNLTKLTTKSSADWQQGCLLRAEVISSAWPGHTLTWVFSHMAPLILQVFFPFHLIGLLHPPPLPIFSTARQCDGCLDCLLYTSPSPRDQRGSRMPSSA